MKGFCAFLYKLRAPLLLIAVSLLMLFAVLPSVRGGEGVTALAAATPMPTPEIILMAEPEPTAAPEPTVAPVAAAGGDAAPLAAGPEYTTFRRGDENAAVADIQQRLMDLFYLDTDEPTQFFGSATESAVLLFQTMHNMPATGEANALTQQILFSDTAKTYTLTRGANNANVEDVQERLAELSYYKEKVNGFFGVATEAAVKAFQKKNRMEVTGVVDMDTLDTIMSPDAKPAVAPTPTPKPKSTPKPATPKPTLDPNRTPSPPDPEVSKNVEGFIEMAQAQLGDIYVRGDEGPDTFDCSGLVHYCLNKAGVSIGRYSAASYANVSSWSRVDNLSDLRRGDLVFFRSSSSSRISHVGIYLGSDKYIHASSSSGKVVISSVGSWFRSNFVLGRRVY